MAIIEIDEIVSDLWDATPSFLKRNLASKPKEERVWWNMWQVMGEILQDYQVDCLYKARQETYVKTASKEALKIIGTDRGFPIRHNELTEDYRTRLLGAYQCARNGGMLKGMADVVAGLGFVGATFQERVNGFASKFNVTLNLGVSETAVKERIEDANNAIESVRPGHKVLNELQIVVADISETITEAAIGSINVKASDEWFDDPIDESFDDPFSWVFADPGSRKRLDLANVRSFVVGTGTPPSMTALGTPVGIDYNVGTNTFSTSDVAQIELPLTQSSGVLGDITEIGLKTWEGNIIATRSVAAVNKTNINSILWVWNITIT